MTADPLPLPDDGIVAWLPFLSVRANGKASFLPGIEKQSMGLSKVDVVRQALQELGDVSAPERAAFIEQRHGVCIEARFIPILRASLRGQEMLDRARQAARAAAQIAEKSSGDGETEGVAEAIAATAPPSRR